MSFRGAPLSFDQRHADILRDVRDILVGYGFTAPGLVAILGLKRESQLYPLEYRELPLYAYKLEQDKTPLAVLVQLLTLGIPSDRSSVEGTLGPDNLHLLCELGLCSLAEGIVHANFTLLPFGNLLIATDRIFPNVDDHGRDGGLSSDNLVWRLDQTSWIMARHLIHRPAREALDLGCGSGLQALLLSPWVDNVTGVDINPRAVNLARFNTLLNGIINAQFLCGDLYQAVKGRRFGQIVSNPPSAPGLVRAWNREGGTTGREVVEAGIEGLGPHLEAGGIFQTTLHLGYQVENDIADWVEDRLPSRDYRCLVIKHQQEQDAEGYSLMEAYQKSGPRDYETFRRTFDLYRQNLKRAEMTRIAFGLLSVHRGPGNRPPEIVTADLQAGNSPEWLDNRMKVLIP